MTLLLKKYCESFINGRISPEVFSESYMEMWKIERDMNLNEGIDHSELLFSAFALADLYNADEDREDYELSGEELRKKIADLFNAD